MPARASAKPPRPTSPRATGTSWPPRKPQDGAELAADNVLVTRLDVLDDASIQSAVAAAHDRFGGIDALLNNAGYGAYGALEATPMDVLRRQFDVNLFGLVAVTQAVLKGMRARRSGVIVNISSVGGRMCYPLGALYHGSKWAVEGLTEAMHYELSRRLPSTPEPDSTTPARCPLPSRPVRASASPDPRDAAQARPR